MLIKGGLEADFYETKDMCLKLARAFEQSSTAMLTSAAGTQLTMRKEGCPGNALFCIVEPGQMSPAPNVEANYSPIEGSAEGVIVADASIPDIDIGVLTEPVTAVVEKGMITGIEGGHQAKLLADDLKSRNDPQVYNVAELGVGLNPKCIMQGIMLEDEGVYGSVHIGRHQYYSGWERKGRHSLRSSHVGGDHRVGRRDCAGKRTGETIET